MENPVLATPWAELVFPHEARIALPCSAACLAVNVWLFAHGLQGLSVWSLVGLFL